MFDWLKQIFAVAEAKSTLVNPEPWLLELFGAGVPTAASISIGPESALRCPVVYACIKIIAESIEQLPLILYRRGDDGAKDRATDHPLYSLLHQAPNAWTTAAEFKMSMTATCVTHGNAYAFINRVGDRVAEIIQIPSTSVAVDVDAATMEPFYKVVDGTGRERVYQRNAILHLRTFGMDPHIGLSPIKQCREAIGLALSMEAHAAKLFGNGARPSGILELDSLLGPAAKVNLRVALEEAHAGAAKSGRTMILERGLRFKPIQFSSVDLQFLELRRHQIAEIARVFRIPLHMVQELERTTHHNAEEMGRQFLTFTLLPWLKMWEGAVSLSCLTPAERQDHYAEFLADDLARAELAARFDAYSKAVTNGLLSPNEVRAAENRPPYVGGDQFRLPLNTESARND